MPGKTISQAQAAPLSGRDQQMQHFDEILQMAEDLDIPLTLDELLLAIQGGSQTHVPA